MRARSWNTGGRSDAAGAGRSRFGPRADQPRDQLAVVREEPGGRQALEQVGVSRALLEHSAQDRDRLLLASARGQRSAVPEGELGVVGLGGVGRGVLAQGARGVALRGELIACIGARLRALEPEQAAELAERVAVVVDAQVDERPLPGPAGPAVRHHEQRR